MLSVGSVVTVHVEKPAAGGRMIARVDGQVLLVGGAIPGERVTARVGRVGRGVAYADTVTVEEPSDDRRAVTADPLCGGCLYAHIRYERQLQVKGLIIEDAFARLGRLPLPHRVVVAGSPEDGYRMRARLHVRNGSAGFFREGTHVLCEARQTRQLLPETCEALDRLLAALRSLGMAGAGELEVTENVDASQRAVHLSLAADVPTGALTGLAACDGFTGLSAASGAAAGIVSGDPHVIDRIAIGGQAVALRRHVRAFFQGNRFLLSPLAAHVVDAVGPCDRVVDLYAGTGLFAVTAAVVRDAHVVAVEGDRVGAADLARNAEVVERGHVEPVHQAVEQFVARRGPTPAVLIVDPPRTGLSKPAIDGAIGLGAERVVYVSCDVATLARDARRFVDAGYGIDRVDGFDLFPNTPHVETVVCFSRSA